MAETQIILRKEGQCVRGVAGSIYEGAALVCTQLIYSCPLHPILQLQCPCSLHHSHMKHIRVHFHYVQDMMDDSKLKVTQVNLAGNMVEYGGHPHKAPCPLRLPMHVSLLGHVSTTWRLLFHMRRSCTHSQFHFSFLSILFPFHALYYITSLQYSRLVPALGKLENTYLYFFAFFLKKGKKVRSHTFFT